MKPWLKHAWTGMGPWKWIGVAAILTVCMLTPLHARGADPGDTAISPCQPLNGQTSEGVETETGEALAPAMHPGPGSLRRTSLTR